MAPRFKSPQRAFKRCYNDSVGNVVMNECSGTLWNIKDDVGMGPHSISSSRLYTNMIIIQ